MPGIWRSDLEVMAGYAFVALDRLPLLRERVAAFLRARGLKGTVLLAPEGINFSVGGTARLLDDWLEWIARHPGIRSPVINRQAVDSPPFLRLKVRIRPEIVTFDPEIHPDERQRGQAVAGRDWDELIAQEQVQLVDTRNDYEYRLGSFDGALNPGTQNFAGFKEFCRRALDPARPVAMFCTGGVRCEKASLWLERNGFDQVFQLHGGILGYLAETPPERSRWHGECFVFDDRVSVDAALKPTGRVVCRGCRKPVEGLDAAGIPPIDADGGCRICDETFDAARLGSLRERARQVMLAATRGGAHLGPEAQQD